MTSPSGIGPVSGPPIDGAILEPGYGASVERQFIRRRPSQPAARAAIKRIPIAYRAQYMTCGETGPKVDPAIDVLAEEAVSNFGEVTDSIARGTPERRPLPADFFVSLSSLRSFPKFFL